MNQVNFDTLCLSRELLHALRDMGFEQPSPIQAETIPLLMENKDVIGQAQTGTGKTAAFAIPIIETICSENRQVQAMVLCPTRELAIQVADEFRKLIQYNKAISVVSIYGGQPIDRQFQALKKKPQIIIGTPGRMLDHLRRGTIKLAAVKTVVLDEADEMLDMGFREDIELILNQTPESRQTVLFSATMPKAILELTQKYQQNPQWVKVMPLEQKIPLIEQQYFEVSQKAKLGVLTHLIDLHQLKLALIFCNTKRQVDNLVDKLETEGYPVGGLHGGMSQSKRDKMMARFRKGAVHLLIATDVAARGIDVQDVQAVFNYDLPENTDRYIHRIGRTGRAGKSGLAFTFVSSGQIRQFSAIQKSQENALHLQSAPGAKIADLKSIDTAREYRRKPKGAMKKGRKKFNTSRKKLQHA